MRRILAAGVLALLSLGATTGCATDPDQGRSGGASDPPPLSQVSTAPAPVSTRTPGPAVTAVCPLLSKAQVTSAVGLKAPKTTEEKLTETARSCRYQSGNRYLQLFVAAEPGAGSADSAANRAIQSYTGNLEPVPGLGDAAYYVGATSPQVVVAVRAEGPQMRTVTLIAFLDEAEKEQLVGLVRAVLERM